MRSLTIISFPATALTISHTVKSATEAADKASATQKEFFNITQENLKPFMEGGQDAFKDLDNFDQAALEATPGYQFALKQGMKAVTNSLTARSLGISGAAQKGAAGFAVGLADQTYGAQFNRLLERAKVGENAAAMVGTAATETGRSIGGNYISAGDAQAASWNAMGAGIKSGATDIGGYYAAKGLKANRLTGA